jgi:hypothetical protein
LNPTAAILGQEGGQVVTWGKPAYGGDSCAVFKDGQVVTWGYPEYTGDSSSVAEELSSNVSNIFSNGQAFAALVVVVVVVVLGSLLCLMAQDVLHKL